MVPARIPIARVAPAPAIAGAVVALAIVARVAVPVMAQQARVVGIVERELARRDHAPVREML